MGKILFFALFISCFTTLSAKTYFVVDSIGAGIPDVVATCFDERMDSLHTTTSNLDGALNISNPRARSLMLERDGYSSRLVNLMQLQSDTITLKGAVELKEVVVSRDTMKQFLTHQSFTISPQAMERYANFYQALNEIPNLTVMSSGTLFYEGNTSVKLLLNGVDTSVQDLSTIAKDDVMKVNVYQTPPARYAWQGVSAVIDVLTKSNLVGGNGGVNISQAAVPLKGNNSLAFYYNYRRSRFSILYGNENNHDKKYRKDERLQYEFEGIEYDKRKAGTDSRSHYDNNNITLSFQNNLAGSYLYNLKVGGALNRDASKSGQVVTTEQNRYLANNVLNTKVDQFWVSNYFEKKIGEKGRYGTAMANITYQRFNTGYYSNYREFSDPDSPTTPIVNESSDYKTHYDAVLCEVQYEFPQKSWGQASISLYDAYKHSRYTDFTAPFYQKSNQCGANAQVIGMKGKFYYQLQMGVHGYHVSTASIAKSYNMWIPTPSVGIYYLPDRSTQLRLSYSYSGGIPTIAELSETEQWVDTKLVYHGNSRLKPYKNHKISFVAAKYAQHFNGSFSVSFQSSPDKICNHFGYTPDYVLETIINLDKYTVVSGQLDLTVMPLGNTKWTIYNRVIGAKVHGRGENYDWDGYRFQWMFLSSVNLKKWSFEAYYQYPGKIAEGQLIRPRAQCWAVSAYFRPMSDMTVGLEWFMPFGKEFKESEHTVSSALVQAENVSRIRDWANMLSLKFSWNFSFGKRHNKANPQFTNKTDDTGILKK